MVAKVSISQSFFEIFKAICLSPVVPDQFDEFLCFLVVVVIMLFCHLLLSCCYLVTMPVNSRCSLHIC